MRRRSRRAAVGPVPARLSLGPAALALFRRAEVVPPSRSGAEPHRLSGKRRRYPALFGQLRCRGCHLAHRDRPLSRGDGERAEAGAGSSSFRPGSCPAGTTCASPRCDAPGFSSEAIRYSWCQNWCFARHTGSDPSGKQCFS